MPRRPTSAPSRPSSPPHPPVGGPLTPLLKWIARFFFVAAVAALGYGFWLRQNRPPETEGPVQVKALKIDWSHEEFRQWESQEEGIQLSYPARYDAVRGFGRFTARDLQDGIEEQDAVAFRTGEPRSVITVATYRSQQPHTLDEWIALAKRPVPKVTAPPPAEAQRGPLGLNLGQKLPPSPLGAEFGGSDMEFRRTEVGGRPALAVTARGAIRYPLRTNDLMEMWRFESLLVAEGTRAVRITAGVHADQYAATEPGLRRTLTSFRWTPPTRN